MRDVIDWFTVVAQIVNFLILVGLLWYFLYGRIMAAMNEREQEISDRWDEARRQREEAAQELEEARKKNRQLDEQREQHLARIRDEVEAYHQQLNAKVRAEAEDLQSRWADAIREETDSFLRDLRVRTAEEVCSISRRALSDLAGENLERQMAERFLNEVAALGDGERDNVLESLEEGERVAVVQTTRQLPDDLQRRITDSLRQKFLTDLEVRFEQSDDLICGIALQTDAHRLAWDLRDYLTSLEQELRKTLEEESAARRPREHEPADVER
jgi:F-type H+-transporting ATPase subunit b